MRSYALAPVRRSRRDDRRPAGPESEHGILRLQRLVGNKAVTGLIAQRLGVAVQRDDLAPAPAPAPGAAPAAPPAPLDAYHQALKDHENDLKQLDTFVTDGLTSPDAMTKNSCQQVTAKRMKVYALTPTHDSAARAAAAGKAAGVAYFSFPGGALYEPAATYKDHTPGTAWDNTNVDLEDSPAVDGFQLPGQIAFMQSAIKKGKDYFLGVLRHEVQHFVDDHGNSDIEGYKTEFRAYWLGSREFDAQSPTTMEDHLGYRWNARQWAIFNDLYTSADYAYVKTAWDAENGKAAKPFQAAVVAFSQPDSVNPHNSTRVADFDKALRAVSKADCAADSPKTPNAKVGAVRTALAALDADDKASIKASTELQALITTKTSDQLLKDLADVIK